MKRAMIFLLAACLLCTLGGVLAACGEKPEPVTLRVFMAEPPAKEAPLINQEYHDILARAEAFNAENPGVTVTFEPYTTGAEPVYGEERVYYEALKALARGEDGADLFIILPTVPTNRALFISGEEVLNINAFSDIKPLLSGAGFDVEGYVQTALRAGEAGGEVTYLPLGYAEQDATHVTAYAGVSKNSPRQKEAAAFIAFLLAEKYAGGWPYSTPMPGVPASGA